MKTIVETIEDELKSINEFEQSTRTKIVDLEKRIKDYTNIAWTFVISGVLAMGFPIASYYCGYGFGNLNYIGDYAGGIIASLWSLAGVFFIYVAFIGQKLQIEQQQIELRHVQGQTKITRMELKEQRFENTFFQLMEVHNQILSLMDYKSTSNAEISKGRDVFRSYYLQFKDEECLKTKDLKYRERKRLTEHQGITGDQRAMIPHVQISFTETLAAYIKVYEAREGDLGHYFRNLYNIIKFIDGANEIADKEKYLNLLLGILSSFELIHLYYFARTEKAEKDFWIIIRKYKIHDKAPDNLKIDGTHDSIAYPQI